jgi:hypothetical protein
VDEEALDELLRAAGLEAVPREDLAPLREMLAAHADLVRPLLGAELGERKSPLEFDPRWTDSP